MKMRNNQWRIIPFKGILEKGIQRRIDNYKKIKKNE